MQLTERELMEISDRLMDHATLIEKFGFYANSCQDQQLRQVIQRQQNTLQSHYNNLLNVLQQGSGTNFTGGQQQYQQNPGSYGQY